MSGCWRRCGVTLKQIPYGRAHIAQQAAAVRLNLYVMGEIHRLINRTAVTIQTAVMDGGETISQGDVNRLETAALAAWEDTLNLLTELMARAMRLGASLPFGTWALHHEAYTGGVLTEGRPFQEMGDPDLIMTAQRDAIVQAARQRVEGDGLTLSQRIWQLDRYGRQQIAAAITTAAAENMSAWQLAQNVAVNLGANQDCPRWTNGRLNGLTKAQIAQGNRTGLITGAACAGQGVAYNALRLARTEIMYAVHSATQQLHQQQPWVEAEKVNLNPQHAVKDQCDDVAAGGENGDGVYEIGEISLPLHPHCMCFFTAVTVPLNQFRRRVRGFLNGGTDAQLATYQTAVGGDLGISFMNAAVALTVGTWIFGGKDEMDEDFWEGDAP